MGTDRPRQPELYPSGISFARGQGGGEEDAVETTLAPELKPDEGTRHHCRTDRGKADRAQANNRGRGILDRRPDLGGAAGGAPRGGPFSRSCLGVYPRGVAA